jgi:succinate dehydrogenase / fumarate reductase iron-sulfur subunit
MAIEDPVAPVSDEMAPSNDESSPAADGVGPLPETVTMRVWRGDEEGGDFAEYQLPAQEGEVVLDVIHRIQATTAPDLACRWNCKAGKCGSCSAEINGRPALMCMTRVDALPPGETVTVAPMRTFPILRDLVTDVSFNYEVAKRVPSFTPRPRTADEEEAGGYRMQQIDVERSQEFRKCIECFLCQDVCHVMRDHEENKTSYAGPRFFIRSAELEMHPLDTNDRRELLQHNQGLGMCNITKCCTEVCPEHIKITDNAIIPLKERVVDATYDPIAWLGRKIRNRRAPRTPSEAAATAPATGPAAVQPSPQVHGIPEPGADADAGTGQPQPYWEAGPTDAHAPAPAAAPDGPAAVPEGPMDVPGGPADGGDDAND